MLSGSGSVTSAALDAVVSQFRFRQYLQHAGSGSGKSAQKARKRAGQRACSCSPIDAKLPLDNYLRLQNVTDEAQSLSAFREDMKRRIDETAKYVRVKDGKVPFAFIFIPVEEIFYDLLVNEVGSNKSASRNLI